MEAQKIYTDLNGINKDLYPIKNVISSLQKFIDKYNDIEGLPTLEENDIQELIRTPKTLFVRKLTNGESFVVGGLTITDDKVFELVEKPNGVLELIEELNNELNSSAHLNILNWIHNLRIVNGKDLIISPAVVKSIEESNTIYLDTEKKQEVYDLLVNIADSLNKLNEHKSIHPENFFENCIKLNSSRKFSIIPQFLKYIK